MNSKATTRLKGPTVCSVSLRLLQRNIRLGLMKDDSNVAYYHRDTLIPVRRNTCPIRSTNITKFKKYSFTGRDDPSHLLELEPKILSEGTHYYYVLVARKF
jgi:hypothetical protein